MGSIIEYTWNFGDEYIISGSGNDDADVVHNDEVTETKGTYRNPQHKYREVGEYTVELTVTTDEGCVKSYSQNIDILPQTEITDFPYTTNFDQDDANWAEEVELLRNPSFISPNSWIYDNTGSGDLLPKYSGDGFWWTGANEGSYYNDEQSWVNGPCFDFTALERPMIGMTIISSTDQGFDGAVLQYSTNGGLSWSNVGDLVPNSGVNWYNSSTISSQPGGQSLGYGWTGELNRSDEDGTLNWIEVKHNLNIIKEELFIKNTDNDPDNDGYNVLIRVAFGSNADNSASMVNGFAFDDVYVGEKQRTVLLEHFTDSEINISRQSDEYLDNIVENRQTNEIEIFESDFITLAYHINDSGEDIFNSDNPEDPSARSLYYSISQAPVAVLDGTEFVGNPFEIKTIDIDRRSLIDPLFKIDIDTLSSSLEVLSVKVEFEAMQVIEEPVVLQIAVIEDVVVEGETYKNVVKKLLLGGEGRSINNPWPVGQKETITYNWDIDVPLYDTEGLSIVAFVQDKLTREIYGAAKIKGQEQQPSTITAVDEKVLEQAKLITVYPNPASEIVHFQLGEIALDNYSWSIVDQRGVTILQGEMEFNGLGVHKANITTLNNGVYYVIIESKGRPLVYRKLAVMNRK